jgi:AAA family ATP:ADP antiporter
LLHSRLEGLVILLGVIVFFIAFILYGLIPSIISVGVVTVFLRVFEYGINKPTRETIFSTLKKNDRYKSTVFIDTFISRFGDLSGSGFIAIGKLTSIAANSLPLIAIPIAGFLSMLGIRISRNINTKDL